MRIQNPKLPTSTEIPDAQPWADRLLAPRDSFIRTLATALQGLLSADNANVEVRELDLFNNTPATILTQRIRGSVVGALLLHTEHDDYARFKWRPLDTNKIELSVKFDVAPPDSVTCRILLIGI